MDKFIKIDKFEKFMIWIGVFLVLYIVFVIIVVVCYFYEYVNRKSWEWLVVCFECCGGYDVCFDYLVFIIKYFMVLVVGIILGFWIWLGKIIEFWKKFFYCLIGVYWFKRDKVVKVLIVIV